MKETEIVFIIDRSGSMSGLEKDTVGSFTSFLTRQRELTPDAVITTVLFNDTYEIRHMRVSIRDAQLKESEYQVGGMTALYDAVGRCIMEVSQQRREGSAGPVVCVIITDGQENASREFSSPVIRHMIADKRALGWDFLFYGARIDENEVGEDLGVLKEDISAFTPSPEGVHEMMASASLRVNEKVSRYNE
ncbi:MAG: VWA domain-containing protein [Sphaerochaetaceae bacterium]|nr:VWA domain-containing protein [Sphaerochaetaceae bacterium]